MVDKIWYNMEELIGGSEERVLIETYWNVKKNRFNSSSKTAKRINRNILECKVTYGAGNINSIICINRNILECKVL